MKIIITGGAGFIGTAVIRNLLENTNHSVVNVDCLTYAANLSAIQDFERSERYKFANVDIRNFELLANLMDREKPDAIMHLAAESHVDRSISGPQVFIETNVFGTFNLLEVARLYTEKYADKEHFRFHHVSTDEVYGDLDASGGFFTEETSYNPSSPYSASKASSDHLVRAWNRTYGLSTLISNCSNNYGPFQFPEKLIPKTIQKILEGKSIPIYGNGMQIRDWLFVDDHATALVDILENGIVGESYNVGGFNEVTNLEVVHSICDILSELQGLDTKGYRNLIEFVDDRPGHDVRYAIDATKINEQLHWAPKETFNSGIRKTVQWYLANKSFLFGEQSKTQ